MKLIKQLSLILMVGITFLLGSCDKTEPYENVIPQSQAHFTGERQQSYAVRTATVAEYNIEVGTTDVVNVDRTVTFKIESADAVLGTQYTIGLPGNTVTIKAGEAIANIPIQGIFAGFPAGRIDTLMITLQEPSVKPSSFMDTVVLAIGDICVEGVGFDITSLLGAYPNTRETFGTNAYGPYNTNISSAVATGPTSGRIVVENIWDNGWGPISFDLDWSNPAALTAIVVPQTAVPGSNAGDINPAYAGSTVAVRASAAGGPGTFSTCNNIITLRMQLGVTGVGYFGAVYTVVMRRS